MTGGEHEPEKVIANMVVEGTFEIRHSHFFLFELAPEFLVLADKPCVSTEVIDGTMLGGGHKPGTRIIRDTGLRPLLDGGDKGVLREIFGQADVPHNAREAGDEPGRLHPPDGLNGAM
jgi:hypothetical protein